MSEKSLTLPKTAAVVLAAGLGTRMKSAKPKVMHPLAGRAMVGHVMAALKKIEVERVVAIVGEGMEKTAEAMALAETVVQHDRLGTGHAVLQAKDTLANFKGSVLIVFGDTPLITPGTLRAMLAARVGEDTPAVVVLGFTPDDPGAYGRLVVDMEDGSLEAIVEAKDADEETLAIDLCNSGVMVVDSRHLWDWLSRIKDDNAKSEYYLTDIVALARSDGFTCAVVEGDADEVLGINSREDLALAEAIIQDRLRARAMEGGATLADPSTVYFSADTKLGQDVTVGPSVVFGPGVVVSDDVEIRAFCHLEGVRVASGAIIGPFARLRPGADIGKDVRIGNFVEIKNALLEGGAKVNHLSYVGDARIGAGANIGAGTITCNYDGFLKSKTDIGKGAFIGSNTALVAPVSIGEGAVVGAGSVITHDVSSDAIALGRGEQRETAGAAAIYRTRKQAEKDKKKT